MSVEHGRLPRKACQDRRKSGSMTSNPTGFCGNSWLLDFVAEVHAVGPRQPLHESRQISVGRFRIDP